MMFSITPRLDDCGLFRLADELTNPWEYRTQFNPLWLRDASGAINKESEVQNTDKEFRIRLDLHHFKPEEVKITSENNRVKITAKHEEKQDNHGFVSREICRVYKLPEDVDPKSVTSTMNSQGVLSIKAAKLALEAPKETAIPVEFKG
ncbi:heat shock protein Hsp-12.2 [Biomphalaria glabrata]|uniref:Heat shock protein Hsp-12.2-like n=1 Tax=Biomphalaria glabrata TaxID=6526 RepID=A0A9U8EFG3_BIOGL|nr:heat shock protein Hsp-12.2-like [Biomphalaria glabrata]